MAYGGNNLIHRFARGLSAFRKAFMSASPNDSDDFASYDARRLRYAILWAHYENTAYSDVHRWATKYKGDYGLYTYTRNIYNPATRLIGFWTGRLVGGQLDPEAGDGQVAPSALPIITDNEALRPAIARLWRDSRWSQRRYRYGRYGSLFGDVALKVVDDITRGRTYIDVLHPGLIAELEQDPFGNVRSYAIEEERPDPFGSTRKVTYREEAYRDGQDVVYRTLLDGRLHAWNGEASEWAEAYGFIPLVVVQHNDVGLPWGWSELHPALSKVREVDDLASKLSDQIRKSVDAPWLFAGIKGESEKRLARSDATAAEPQKGREQMAALYGPVDAKAYPLVAPLDIAGALAHIAGINQELEREYPELAADLHTASGDASGRALRVARQRATTKVESTRPVYDDGLVRAQQMAIAIGGYRGYTEYQGFGLESYDAGDLDHSIGSRPVFAPDAMDRLEEQEKMFQVVESAVRAGLALPLALREVGWSEERIAEVLATPEYEARIRLLELSRIERGQQREEQDA